MYFQSQAAKTFYQTIQLLSKSSDW